MEEHQTFSKWWRSNYVPNKSFTMENKQKWAIVRRKEEQKKTQRLCIGRMPNAGTYWCHFGFRINEEDLKDKSHSQRKDVVNQLADRLVERFQKNLTYYLVVGHTYPFYLIEDHGKRDHLHVVFRHYKGSATTAALRDFAKARDCRFWFSKIRFVEEFIKYLLQGRGREVLHEKGTRPKNEGVPPPGYTVQTGEEASMCEPSDGGSGGGGTETIRSSEESGGGSVAARDLSISGSGRICTKKQMEREDNWQQIQTLLKKYRTSDEISFANKILASGDKQLISWYNHNSVEPSWQANYATASAAYQVDIMNMRWEDILRWLPEDPNDYERPCLSVEDSIAMFSKWCVHQKLDIKQFVTDIWATVDKWHPRKNTLLLYGQSETGKSWLGDSLGQSLGTCFNNGTFNRQTSTFAFQDIIRKRGARVEECSISAEHVENIKCLFGGQAFDVNVKFKSAGKVQRTPVICTTNKLPWVYVPDSRQALEDRCYRYNINQRVNFSVGGSIHPKAFLVLGMYYGVTSKPVNTTSIGGAFDPSILGEPAQGVKRGSNAETLEAIMYGSMEGSDSGHSSKRARRDSDSESGDSDSTDDESETGQEDDGLPEESNSTGGGGPPDVLSQELQPEVDVPIDDNAFLGSLPDEWFLGPSLDVVEGGGATGLVVADSGQACDIWASEQRASLGDAYSILQEFDKDAAEARACGTVLTNDYYSNLNTMIQNNDKLLNIEKCQVIDIANACMECGDDDAGMIESDVEEGEISD